MILLETHVPLDTHIVPLDTHIVHLALQKKRHNWHKNRDWRHMNKRCSIFSKRPKHISSFSKLRTPLLATTAASSGMIWSVCTILQLCCCCDSTSDEPTRGIFRHHTTRGADRHTSVKSSSCRPRDTLLHSPCIFVPLLHRSRSRLSASVTVFLPYFFYFIFKSTFFL